jgi:hypothetical protein
VLRYVPGAFERLNTDQLYTDDEFFVTPDDFVCVNKD